MKRDFQGHEDFRRPASSAGGSDRGFGLVFAVVFMIIGLFPLWSGTPPYAWALVLAAAFLMLALAWPRALHPLNRLWTAFGLALHKIVSPVILAILYYGTVVPTGVALKLFGKDPLQRRFDVTRSSYWIMRDPPGPSGESMKNQF
jgi:ABC-type Fe3+-siderophore transport system permease subunit